MRNILTKNKKKREKKQRPKKVGGATNFSSLLTLEAYSLAL